MSYKIGICDDNYSHIIVLDHYLKRYFKASEYSLIKSNKPLFFLEEVKEGQLDCCFLDVDMGPISGIDLAMDIKAFGKDIVIIFVSAYQNYAFDAFGVRAFHYLLKPLKYKDFEKVMDLLIKELDHKKVTKKVTKKYHVNTKKESYYVATDDIEFFEKIGHKIRLKTESKEITYYGTFTELLKDLDTASFVQCHQGYIVNIDKIRRFSGHVLYLNGEKKIPVSRSKESIIRHALENKLFNED